MKYKYLLLLIALFALSGCSNDERSSQRVDGGGINTGQPSSSTYYSHIRNSNNDAEFTTIIKMFLAYLPTDTVYDIDIGTVAANTDSPVEGMQVRLQLGISSSQFTSWSSVNSNTISLAIKIYDSYTYPNSGVICEGNPCGPITLEFPAGSAEVSESGSQIEITFTDTSGIVWLKGSMNGDIFSGNMYFDNANNEYQGHFGSFSFPKCALFTNGCSNP